MVERIARCNKVGKCIRVAYSSLIQRRATMTATTTGTAAGATLGEDALAALRQAVRGRVAVPGRGLRTGADRGTP